MCDPKGPTGPALSGRTQWRRRGLGEALGLSGEEEPGLAAPSKSEPLPLAQVCMADVSGAFPP